MLPLTPLLARYPPLALAPLATLWHAPIRAQLGWTPLILAAAGGHGAVARELLAGGAHTESANSVRGAADTTMAA